MDNWLEILTRVARNVHVTISGMLGSPVAGKAMGKGAGGDVSRKVDMDAEQLALDHLQLTGEPIKVITEERGILYFNEAEDVDPSTLIHVIMDPIDGSFNAVRGVPAVTFAIAAGRGPLAKNISEGVVMNLCTGDLFTASRGTGAFLNGRPIAPSEGQNALDGAAIALDINPKQGQGSRASLLRRFMALIDLPRKIRLLGTNALGTALVASGSLDAFLDLTGNLRLLDIMASWLIVKEAGGIMVHIVDSSMEPLDDLPLDIEQRVRILAAANEQLASDIIKRLDGNL